MSRPCVFIHTNHRQYLGALVSAHSLRRASRHADRFDVRILHARDYPFLHAREGQTFLRDRAPAVWTYEDLQSFTPLRFQPPAEMGYTGRALVIDPDVFAVGDVHELLSRDMHGRAILCRPRSRRPEWSAGGDLASSVMLLDCARLERWRCEEQFGELFAFERDYKDWISLRHEPRDQIGLFEAAWNDFDRLTPETRLLHNTKRLTQPWKTGLPVDFRPARKRLRATKPGTWLRPVTQRLFGAGAPSHYVRHPDPAQERLFFDLLRECVDRGVVSEDLLREEMGRNHLRHDAFELLARAAPAAA